MSPACKIGNSFQLVSSTAVAVSSLINVEMFTLPKVQQDKVINSGLFLCFDTYTKYRRDRTDETRIC
jgi:hypothetical protein